jgi:uncharacterized protein (TIGR00251 family)
LINISEKDGAVLFAVKVVPRASRSEIVGTLDGAVKVRLASPPVDGAANAELIKLFSKMLGVPKSDVEIVSGQTSRSKQLRIAGVPAEKVKDIIG